MAWDSGEPAPRLRMAVQKDGRLTEQTLALLGEVGLRVETHGQRLYSAVRNFGLDLLFTRDDDIPQYVASGTADLGVVGRNLVEEEGVEVAELLALGFGHCALVLAVPRDGGVGRLADLAGKRIATKYPRTARRFLAAHGVVAELVALSGALELAPVLDLASAIIDISATGSSLVAHDLVPLCEIARSEAVLVAHPAAVGDDAKGALIRRLLVRLNGSLAARGHKYLVLNAPAEAVERIARIVPGLRRPSVIPLAEPGWVAVQTIVREDVFWEVLDELRAAGAEGILVGPVEQMLLGASEATTAGRAARHPGAGEVSGG
jgi:ATP phosphoribosyltransferase